jgi:hypothetical protein
MSKPEASGNNDKIKYIVLGVIGVVAVIYAINAVVFAPIQAKKVKMKAELQDLSGKVRKASIKVNRIPTLEKRSKIFQEDIYNISDNYILKHQLGNYFIQVKEYISLVALDCDIKIADILEAGIDVYDKPINRKSENSLKIYNVRVNMVGDLHSLIKFLKDIEDDNPYVVISSLRITSNEATPSFHKISLNILWPIWAKEEFLQKYSSLGDEEVENEN